MNCSASGAECQAALSIAAVRVLAACAEHQLPVDPFDEQARQAANLQALKDAAEIMAATAAELDEIVPSIDILLP